MTRTLQWLWHPGFALAGLTFFTLRLLLSRASTLRLLGLVWFEGYSVLTGYNDFSGGRVTDLVYLHDD